MTLRVAQFFLKIAHLSFSMGPRGPRAYGLRPRLWLLPVINTAEAKGIDIVAHNRSLAAKAITYKLLGDRSFGFLYTAKQIRTFPVTLTTFITRQMLASMTTAAKLLFDKSSEDISALTCSQDYSFLFCYCLLKRINDYLKLRFF